MGYKIKEKRKERNMTQDQLAKQAGVSRTTISGLESGKTSVTSTQTIRKIANALKCEVGDIFCN
jgi:transcriptional regulator, XRE family